MRLLKYLLQRAQPPRWSTLLATVFYLLFVLFILNLSFPLRSTTVFDSMGSGRNLSEFGRAVQFSTDRKRVTTSQLMELKEAFFR